MVGVVVFEDPVETRVESGENAHKTLVQHYAARSFQHQYVTLEGKKESSLEFPVQLESTWNAGHLGVAVFVQDNQTGFVHQADSRSWKSDSKAVANEKSLTGSSEYKSSKRLVTK
jgi:hypothetical protein